MCSQFDVDSFVSLVYISHFYIYLSLFFISSISFLLTFSYLKMTNSCKSTFFFHLSTHFKNIFHSFLSFFLSFFLKITPFVFLIHFLNVLNILSLFFFFFLFHESNWILKSWSQIFSALFSVFPSLLSYTKLHKFLKHCSTLYFPPLVFLIKLDSNFWKKIILFSNVLF